MQWHCPFHLFGHIHTCSEAGKWCVSIHIANAEVNVEWLIHWHLSWELGTQFIGVCRVWLQRTCGIVRQKITCIGASIERPKKPLTIDERIRLAAESVHRLCWSELHAWQNVSPAFDLTKLLWTFAVIERYALWMRLIATWRTIEWKKKH